MPFEERGLRLEGGNATAERLDDAKGELSRTVHVVVKSPFLQEASVRIDAHAHGAKGAHGSVQTVAEASRGGRLDCGSSHRVSSDRMESHSCSERTEYAPRIRTSIACTIALNAWSVVTAGRSCEAAAARIW